MSVIQETKSHLEDVSVLHQSVRMSVMGATAPGLKSVREDSGEYAVSQLVNSMLRNSKLAALDDKTKGSRDPGWPF